MVLRSKVRLVPRYILSRQKNACQNFQHSHNVQPLLHYGQYPNTGPLDIARFTMLSIATLPFTLWVGKFSYDYFYRVECCVEALNGQDEELSILFKEHEDKNNEKPIHIIGRDKELTEVKHLLEKDPHQVILVAGANESGKSHFVSEVLRGINNRKERGVTHIQLAQLVNSVSSFTYILVHAFNLKWLSMRYSLMDVLPFAGSENLVMKEGFSDHDLGQALRVITEALKQRASSSYFSDDKKGKPVIVVDGLAEGKSWTRTQEGKQCLQRFFQWCIYVTKERKLAHIIITGNEELVLSLTDQNRLTRGHVKVVGLGDLNHNDARQLILQEMPDATEEEIQKIIDAFGGFVHDVRGSSRDIQDRLGLAHHGDATRAQLVDEVIATRHWHHVERVTSAFAKGRDDDEEEENHSNIEEGSEEEEEMDPLKVENSLMAKKLAVRDDDDDDDKSPSYSKLQLWQTLQALVYSEDGTVSFAQLRDEIFDGKKNPILELMDDDVLGFEIDNSLDVSFSWKVKPATPALRRAFRNIVRDSSLKEKFLELENNGERQEKIKKLNAKLLNSRKERKLLEQRKMFLFSTVELNDKLGRNRMARRNLASSYDALVEEEQDALIQDRKLRLKLKELEKKDVDDLKHENHPEHEIRQNFKTALLNLAAKDVTSSVSYQTRYPQLWKAFKSLDASKDGLFNAEDVARVIQENTGKEVELEAVRKMLQVWDTDNDKHLNFEELINMFFMTGKNEEDLKTMIHRKSY